MHEGVILLTEGNAGCGVSNNGMRPVLPCEVLLED
jgi:hypothetical protein